MSRHWILYIVGIALPFIIKYGNHMLQENPQRFGLLVSTVRFLFADVPTSMKTITNLAAEWVIGAIYMGELALPFADLSGLPKHVALSFFLGFTAETLIVPPFISFMMRRFGPVTTKES